MNLIQVLRQECIQARAEYASKDEALAALAHLAMQSPVLENIEEARILKGLTDREELSTTGFGHRVL